MVKSIIFLFALLMAPAVFALSITNNPLNDQLFEAIEYRYDIPAIEALLKKGADPDAVSVWNVNNIEEGDTIWMYALMNAPSATIALLKQYRKQAPLSPKFQARAFSIAMSTTQASNPNYAFERMQMLLDHGLDPNAIDMEDLTHKSRRSNDGLSPLMVAAQHDRSDFVMFLVKHGAKADLRTRTGETALFYVRSADIARDLLEAGADAGAVGQNGRTALFAAIMEGYPDVVRVLLDKGGDLNRQNANEAFLLACRVMRQTKKKAAAESSPTIIEMFLEHGLDPNLIVEKEGWKSNPLLEAVHANNAEAVKLLLDAGADPLKVRNGNGSLLELAVQQEDPWITQLLLPKYVPLSDADKKNLLHVVLQYGKPKSIAILAENGISVNPAKDAAATITAMEGINRAVAEDHSEKVQALLTQGLDINASGYNHTPLTGAIYYKNRKMVEFLVEKGADVNRVDKSGMTPLATAIVAKDRGIYEFLLSKKADPKLHDPAHPYLMLAVQSFAAIGLREDIEGAVEILKSLIKAGHAVDQVDGQGVTPLWQLSIQRPYHPSAESTFVEIAQLLLTNGAAVDAISLKCKDIPVFPAPSKEGMSSGAIARDVENRVQVDPVAQLKYLCQTPLANAVSVGNNAVAAVLMEAGANVNWQSPTDQDTPLMHAAFFGNPKSVALLLGKGADPTLRNKQGKTAADIARDVGNTKALALLENFK